MPRPPERRSAITSPDSPPFQFSTRHPPQLSFSHQDPRGLWRQRITISGLVLGQPSFTGGRHDRGTCVQHPHPPRNASGRRQGGEGGSHVFWGWRAGRHIRRRSGSHAPAPGPSERFRGGGGTGDQLVVRRCSAHPLLPGVGGTIPRGFTSLRRVLCG